jgi:hypothetical protein
MLCGNEKQSAFSCVGYPMACTVAGPHGPVFLPMGILETRRTYRNGPSAIKVMKRAILDLNGDHKLRAVKPSFFFFFTIL